VPLFTHFYLFIKKRFIYLFERKGENKSLRVLERKWREGRRGRERDK